MRLPHYFRKYITCKMKLFNFFNKLQKKIKFTKNKLLLFKLTLNNLETLQKRNKILKNQLLGWTSFLQLNKFI